MSEYFAFALIFALAVGLLPSARQWWIERRLRRRVEETIRGNLPHLIALRAALLGTAQPQAWHEEAERFVNSQIMSRLTPAQRHALAQRRAAVADLVGRRVGEAAAFPAYYRS